MTLPPITMNDIGLLPARYEPGVVALSMLIAAFASYVALDLARRVRGPDRASARAWIAGGALVIGSGVWSMHFVGMLAFELPIALGYRADMTLWSWVAAVGVSGLALALASRETLTPRVLATGAVAMGGGICAMHYVGMAAIDVAPGIVWNWAIVATSALIAVVASAAALLIFFGMRRLRGLQARLAQVGAALVMGAAISGMHYTGMAAAGFPEGTLCLSADALGGDNLGALVIAATVVLLSITLVTSIVDARLQARANLLANRLAATNRELQVANDELQRLAFNDPLTGVPNLARFDDRLQHALTLAARRPDRHLGVLFIDLDGFKSVNDSWGHAVGDQLLRQVAGRLRATVTS
ncbi:MAG: diguanylate cyclase [Burkholderiaceae bacterium]|nr:diguanylate cyclase [Rhodoferax sp.]MCP5285181.1 diguanylate cyclase [Burkholderiaceae bacterium]